MKKVTEKENFENGKSLKINWNTRNEKLYKSEKQCKKDDVQKIQKISKFSIFMKF